MIRRFLDAIIVIAILFVVAMAIINRDKFSSMVGSKPIVKPTEVVDDCDEEKECERSVDTSENTDIEQHISL